MCGCSGLALTKPGALAIFALQAQPGTNGMFSGGPSCLQPKRLKDCRSGRRVTSREADAGRLAPPREYNRVHFGRGAKRRRPSSCLAPAADASRPADRRRFIVMRLPGCAPSNGSAPRVQTSHVKCTLCCKRPGMATAFPGGQSCVSVDTTLAHRYSYRCRDLAIAIPKR